VEYRILGPLEVIGDDGSPVALPGVRERTLLAALLVSTNQVVSTDRLGELLWGDDLPPTAANALQALVSKLRRRLAAESGELNPIHTQHPGYVLRTVPGEIDAKRFETLLRSEESSHPAEAAARLNEALSLWRGDFLSDLPVETFRNEAVRLEELRLVALERRVHAELSLGAHDKLVAELETLVRQHPFREGFRGQLMLALYRSGRQADALAVYRQTRTFLAEELGIDPSKSLQDLELAILGQAPELGTPTLIGPAPTGSSTTGSRSTLTFLFTDIEGSTRKLTELGDLYTKLLEQHHEIIRNGLCAHDGIEVSTAGDAFFAVFPSASACVRAVIEMQRHFAATVWPSGREVRVRMGVHTGEASKESVGFVGLDVVKAARIAAVGHGGQVLMSLTTAALLSGSPVEETRLRDLGFHQLKDVQQPMQIFQLEADGLDATFPPLNSLSRKNRTNNLPAQLSSFVGRSRELHELSSILESNRLVTLAGVGGCGKTRLALHVASDLLDRFTTCWFVDLAPLTDPELVTAAAAAAVGVGEQSERPLVETLVEALSERTLLVVFDNCEHVIGACVKLVECLLRACPQLTVIATSREPLGVTGEYVYRVSPLELPPIGIPNLDPATLLEFEAVELFVTRAKTHNPGFVLDESSMDAVVSICANLDGIPLAIELAAARAGSLSLADLEARVSDRFRLLKGGSRTALPRQQTLRALIDWSYEALNYRDRAVLDRLSVFAGGFDLAAAEDVCASEDVDCYEVVDAIGSLVDKSLIQSEPTGSTMRYRLLETIRQYASEQLAGSEVNDASARDAHARAFRQLAEAAADQIHGPRQLEWLTRLEVEHDNLRAANGHFLTHADSSDEILRLGAALREFWIRRGHAEEGIDVLRRGLELQLAATPSVRASALAAAAHLCLPRGQLDAASRYVEEGLSIAAQSERSDVLADLKDSAVWIDFFQHGQVDLSTINDAVETARRSGDKGVVARVLAHRGGFQSTADPIAAKADLDEALAHFRSSGDAERTASALNTLGTIELSNHNLNAAREHLEEGRAIARPVSLDEYMVITMTTALLEIMEGDISTARHLILESMKLSEDLNAPREIVYNLLHAALCLTAVGNLPDAIKLHAAADTLIESMGQSYEPLEMTLRLEDHDRLHTSVGDAAFMATYGAGRLLNVRQATELARQELERPPRQKLVARRAT
jgi:predicted ATPase/DNA-binding SARP family transcriptional activator/class 3 adenylate cyclase